jgi:hypothetical protein
MRRALLIAILAAGLANVALGCSGDDTCSAGAKETADASVEATSPPLDAGAGRDATPPPGPRFSLDGATGASVRVANWSADAPAVDFCVAPHGTSLFQGPLLVALATDNDDEPADAGAPGSFPNVSPYLPIAPGQYDARLVAAGSTDCLAAIIGDATALPALAAGEAATFALVGATQPQGAQPALEIVGFLDDTAIPSGVAMRVINAAIDLPQIDFGVGTKFQAPFLMIGFGAASVGPDASADASTMDEAGADASALDGSRPDGSADAAAPPMVDSNGYFPEKLSAATLTARASGSTTAVATATNVTIAPGVNLTIAVLASSTADGGASARLLACVDNAGTAGDLAACNFISP